MHKIFTADSHQIFGGLFILLPRHNIVTWPDNHHTVIGEPSQKGHDHKEKAIATKGRPSIIRDGPNLIEKAVIIKVSPISNREGLRN
jgi:hypothetical protein